MSRVVAAFVAGAGGLLVEIGAVRRLGLSVGNTAEAAAMVVGVFLLGLGLGGLVVARWGRVGRAGAMGSALAYAAVAVLVLAGEASVRAIGSVSPWAALPLTLLHPGASALAMGIAFPLLFGRSLRAGLLIAANLAGSVVACAVGANLVLPVAGIVATHRVGALCYGVAALAAAIAARGSVGYRDAPEASGPEAVASSPAMTDMLANARRLSFLSGFGVVGLQIVLLRRMPFFVEGFQPTFAGVVAVCLLASSAGAVFGPRLVRACLLREPDTAPARSLGAACVATLLGGVACCAGLHEHFAASIARITVTSEVGMHARIWLAALVAAGPACLCFGAVVPLALDAVAPPGTVERARVAGSLFFAQGVGSLTGALWVGHALPAFAPESFFVWAPVATAWVVIAFVRPAGLAVRAVAILAVVSLSVLGIAGPGRPWAPDAPVRGSRFDRPGQYRYLAHRTDATVTASVVYDRSNHSMVLFTDEFRAAYTGPDTAYMKVLGHLPFLLRSGLEDVAVIALGTGTTADAVSVWPDPRAIHVVEISPAVLSLVDWFAGDGPVAAAASLRAPFAVDARTRIHVEDGRYWLSRQEPASLDLITMEPLLPYAPGTAPLYSAEFYALAASRLREDGMIVQWVPTHAMPEDFFVTLLATFGGAFDHTSAWLIDQSTLLVGSATPHVPPLPELVERLRNAPPRAGRTLHEAGLATLADLEVAHLGVMLGEVFDASRPGVRVLVDDRPFLERIGYWSGAERLAFYPDNLEQLLALVDRPTDLETAEARTVRSTRIRGLVARARGRAAESVRLLEAARAMRPDSVLLHHEQTLSWRDERERRAAALPADEAAKVAKRQLDRDEASASLYLDVARSETDPQRAATMLAAALAVDPLALARRPELSSRATEAFRRAQSSVARRSPLEDVAALPDESERLLELALGTAPLAVGIRAAFPVRVARAAVEAASSSALPSAAATLRSCFDPHSLDRLASVVATREGRAGDLIAEVATPFWRTDLPMPRAFADLLRAPDPARRIELANALVGHRGPRAIAVLAALLDDDRLEVREAAGTSLFRLVGRRIPYDPTWPENRLRLASQALRGLQALPR